MKVFDCINYNGEQEMLDIRLNVLDGVVDYFIISECEVTFTELVKPLFFKEQKQRFKKFWRKIIFREIQPILLGGAWLNERYQRNTLWLLLNEIAKEEDAILYSGVDEIPKPEKIFENRNKDKAVFMMKPCYYWINCLSNESDFHGTFLIKKKSLDSYYYDCPYFIQDEEEFKKNGKKPNGGIYWTFEEFGLDAARVDKANFTNKIKNAGWHYQWYGGTTECAKKFLSYSHMDGHLKGLSRQDLIKKQMEKMQGIYPESNITLKKVDLDQEIAPQYILDNPQNFDILV